MDFDGLNWIGLALAVVANMAIGFLWYLPNAPTGKAWMKAMGMSADTKPAPGTLAKGLVLSALGAFLLMFVFAHNSMVYEDAFRNAGTGGDAAYDLTVADGLFAGLFTWLGFFVPVQLSAVAWEGKPWSVFLVNAGYYLVTLLVAGVLITSVGT